MPGLDLVKERGNSHTKKGTKRAKEKNKRHRSRDLPGRGEEGSTRMKSIIRVAFARELELKWKGDRQKFEKTTNHP